MSMLGKPSSSNYLVVVAIDFGTTYSGYAFSFKSKPLDVKTNQSWSKTLISLKTPTVLLLDPKRKFHSFGFEAEEKYGDLLMDEESQGWGLFRRFKMVLYENPSLTMSTEITDLSGSIKMSAISIFTMSIRYLKNHALDLLNNTKKAGVNVRESDVYFVLTIPAIWDDKARLFMREAAVQAGINREQLGMALESEAASIWCQSIPLVIQTPEDRNSITNIDSKYMVVDIGGGTADVAVHQKLSNGKLRELEKSSGGDWGGTQVDKRFMAMLTDVLGRDAMMRFYKECIGDVFDLLKEFETAKRTITPNTTGTVKVRLPVKLHEIKVEESAPVCTNTQLRRSFNSTLNSSKYGERISIKGDKLRVDANFAKDMFSFSINELVKCIKDLFDSPSLDSVDTIMVVGGFSECALVQDAFKITFPTKKIIFPSEAGLAVLKGAVLFGHNPQIVDSRKARFTYGIKIMELFDPSVHDKRYRVIRHGKEMCDKRFQIYVRKGSSVHSGYTISEKHVPSKEEIQGGYTKFHMYMSTDTNPTYVTEPSCVLLGTLEVRMPDGENKAYETSFVFGDTEIMLVVKHLHSGKMFSRYFNFC